MSQVCARKGWRLEAGGWTLQRLGFALSLLLVLSACGSAPERLETTEPVSTVTTVNKDSGSRALPTGIPPASSSQPQAQAEAPIPQEAQMQFDNAIAAMNAGNTGSAEQSFRTLSAAYPTFAGPLLNLAILQTKAGKLEDAQKALNDAIARKPSAAAYNQLGIVYRRLGRFKEADEAYQRAIQADESYALAYLNLGVLCDLYLQQPQRALEAYERYVALAPSPDAKVNGWITELKTRLGAQRSAKAE